MAQSKTKRIWAGGFSELEKKSYNLSKYMSAVSSHQNKGPCEQGSSLPCSTSIVRASHSAWHLVG